jgi:hypothetical protein
LGARGRGAAPPLSARSRRTGRAARRRPRGSFRITDPARAAAGILAFACACGLLVALFSDVAVIDDVRVEGARHLSREAAVSQSGLVGAATLSASAAEARTRLRTLPAVRDARIEIRLPGTAQLVLMEREAFGRWVAADGVEWFVDRDGILFPSLDRSGAPDLRVYDERAPRMPGERIDPALVAAAMRLAALAPGELRPDATGLRVVMTAGADGLVLRTAARWEIRFGGADRFDEKLSLARRWLRENAQRRLDYVDVRSPDRIVFFPN